MKILVLQYIPSKNTMSLLNADEPSFVTEKEALESIKGLEVKKINNMHELYSAATKIAVKSKRGAGNIIYTGNPNFSVEHVKVQYIEGLEKSYIAYNGPNRTIDGAILENNGEFQVHPEYPNLIFEIDLSKYA